MFELMNSIKAGSQKEDILSKFGNPKYDFKYRDKRPYSATTYEYEYSEDSEKKVEFTYFSYIEEGYVFRADIQVQ